MVATISADGLVKRYGEQAALDGFDLEVERGTVFGLLGPNGAGKTTAVRAFATLLRYDAGDAQVAGRDPVTEPHEVRRRIGLSGQTPAVDGMLGGRENLGLFGRLNRMSRREAQQRADELLGKFGLADAADKQVKHYSGGMRRRLDLAVTLLLRPEVLFLDEPTTGLDPRNRAEVWEAVRSLAADGTTVLLTTQYLDEADQLAGRVAVMEAGRVIAEGTPDELKREVGGDQLEVVVEESAETCRSTGWPSPTSPCASRPSTTCSSGSPGTAPRRPPIPQTRRAKGRTDDHRDDRGRRLAGIPTAG